jgi:hypothetical protein
VSQSGAPLGVASIGHVRCERRLPIVATSEMFPHEVQQNARVCVLHVKIDGKLAGQDRSQFAP